MIQMNKLLENEYNEIIIEHVQQGLKLVPDHLGGCNNISSLDQFQIIFVCLIDWAKSYPIPLAYSKTWC